MAESAQSRRDGPFPRRPSEQDAVLRDRILRQLTGRLFLGPQVEVEVIDGMATVRGRVANRSEGAVVLGVVREVPGVRDVQGLLRVREND